MEFIDKIMLLWYIEIDFLSGVNIMFYSQRSINLHSFGAYAFSYYKSLEIRNWDFAEKVLPVYLKQIMEDKRTLRELVFETIYLTYEADERCIIGKVIDTFEKAALPMFSLGMQRFYDQAVSLSLLAIFSESYHFANVNEPIQKDDTELFFTLLKICNMNDFAGLSSTFCLRSSRQTLERQIWYRLDEIEGRLRVPS